MGTIVVMGGGELSELETLGMDREIVNLTNKLNPKALFIPTASNDAPGYCDSFKHTYGDILGCETRNLLLATKSYSHEEIVELIMSSDLIYVGGGNTRHMLDIWKKYGVDKILKDAYSSGIILSGLSAGSICWFQYGHSDIETLDENGQWKYIKLEALGILKGIHCPHYDENNRVEDFLRMVKGGGLTGIAVENNCAIIFMDNEYKIISTKDEAKAYKVLDSEKGVIVTELDKKVDFRPIDELYSVN